MSFRLFFNDLRVNYTEAAEVGPVRKNMSFHRNVAKKLPVFFSCVRVIV
jgi:hypothetical protein